MTAFGVNAHLLWPSAKGTEAPVFAELYRRGLTSLRCDYYLGEVSDAAAMAALRNHSGRAKAIGSRLYAQISTRWMWEAYQAVAASRAIDPAGATDGGRYPAGDADALYRQGYDRTYAFCLPFAADGITWELGNELCLLVRDASGQPLWGKGQTAAEWDVPLFRDARQVVLGMSDALAAIEAQTGYPQRVMLNFVSTMLGSIDYFRAGGVNHHVSDVHVYEDEHLRFDQWWMGTSPPVDLHAECLRRWPDTTLVLGEGNGRAVYDPAYKDDPADPLTLSGYRALKALLDQAAKFEAVHAYELTNNADASVPAEQKFGTMYTLAHPKPALLLLARAAGGWLSADELAQLAALGL